MQRPSLHQLEIFCQVVRHGSMAQAAAVLGVMPSSVSMQLQQLQQRCGVQLLERAGRGVIPTVAGRLLYERAETVLRAIDAIERDLTELAAVEAGVLQFASSRTIATYLVPAVLRAYERRHPRIDVDYHIMTSSERVEMAVLERHAEFGLVGRVRHGGVLAVEQILEENLLVVVAPRHPFALIRSPSLEHVASYPLLLREQPVLASDYVLARLSASGFTPLIVELESTEAIKGCVMAGEGLAILPESSVSAELVAGLLVSRRIPDLRPKRAVYLVYPREARLSAAASAFVALAYEVIGGAQSALADTIPERRLTAREAWSQATD